MKLFPDRYTLISFNIGSLSLDIRWYAFLILIGAFGAYLVSRNEAKKAKYINMEWFDSLFIYTLWVGIIGARLWYCAFFNLKYYLANPADIIRIWDGGLAIQGGIVAGAIFVYCDCRYRHVSFMKIIDILLPNVLIGQGMGRWGNFVNQECHGGEVDASYFDGILSFLKNGMYINGHYYEPLFFYESMLCFIGFLLIHFVLKKRQNKRGDLGYCYLMWYGVVRFFIEGRRTDSLYLGSFRMAQLTSIAFVVIGLLGYLGILQKFFRKDKPTIIFDMDGTLVDTRDSIIAGYEALFKKYSSLAKFTPEIKNEVIGPALRDLFPKYFPGVDYDELYAVYRARQREVAPVCNKPTENTPMVLKTLHDDGYHIAVLSTRTHEGIVEILKSFELDGYVDDICGLNDVKNLKPDPEGIRELIGRNGWNRDSIMVGDSVMDINCGKNYGSYTVGYLLDADRSEEIVAAKANEIITDMAQLLDIVKKNIDFTYNKL